MPVNAGLFYPGTINASTGKRCDDLPLSNWYLSGLEQAYKSRTDVVVDIKIEKNKAFTKPKACILNTIDATYGHALFELLNASYYIKKEDVDLIILVQSSMRWLVPAGATEVWVVDISFGKAVQWFNDLALKIKQLTAEIPLLYLCKSFVQADSLDFQIEDYTGVKPFPLDEWDDRIKKGPVVTFIWRHDRFWKPVLNKVLDNRYTRKLGRRQIDRLRKTRQHQWIVEFSQKLKKQIPEVDFAVAGMDTRDLLLPPWIKDFRYPEHRNDTAKLQCERYARSHVIIGCNGSSLVLPGCHAGAMVNIVPGDSWAVSEGSFPFRVTSAGDTHFRYVMMPCEVTQERVISVVVSILRDRSLILLHTSDPWRNHEAALDPMEWSKFRVRALSLSSYFNTGAGLITSTKEK